VNSSYSSAFFALNLLDFFKEAYVEEIKDAEVV